MRPAQHDSFAPVPEGGRASEGDPSDEADAAPARSLFADVEALIDDGRTYFGAELSYQKSRAGFVGNRVKLLAGLGLGALFFVFMALFGLTLGLILALTPLITAWGATAVVVGLLLICAWLMVRKAGSVWQAMLATLDEKAERGGHE